MKFLQVLYLVYELSGWNYKKKINSTLIVYDVVNIKNPLFVLKMRIHLELFPLIYKLVQISMALFLLYWGKRESILPFSFTAFSRNRLSWGVVF